MQLDTCRDRVDRVREETAPKVAAASARHFYNARLQTAEVVKRSISSWNAERKERKGAFSERTHQNTLIAHSARKGAKDGKQALQQMRSADASKIRASIAHIETRDKHLKLEEEAKKRAAHDARYRSCPVMRTLFAHHRLTYFTVLSPAAAVRLLRPCRYASRYVESDMAKDFETSAWTDVSNAHREGLDPTKIREVKPRGTWQTYFGGSVQLGGSGFFSARV